MDGVTALGMLAGALTTIAFLPQVVKTWKSKSAKDLSFGMLASFSTGVLLWLIYGLLIDSLLSSSPMPSPCFWPGSTWR